jgi:hypothetical protein
MTKTYHSIPIKKNKTIRTNKKYCMDVEFGDKNENARFIGYPCHGGPNQKFRYNNKTKQLIAKHSRKCMENVAGRIYQKTCDSSKKTQKWIRKKGKWMSMDNKKCVSSEEYGYCGIPPLVTYPCKKKASWNDMTSLVR